MRRAADTSLRHFPYYGERFGERGALFARSDGAWLALLCGGDAALVEEEVLWLGRVLSSRGVPRWLLERHLSFLHAQLTESLPRQRERYEPLRSAADGLAERRRSRIPDADANALRDEFRRAADPGWRKRLPEMGDLLVSAAADEADGITRAVESLETWAADPERFPGPWISAVRDTVSSARRRARSGG